MKQFLISITLLCSLAVSATTKQIDVIYGEDNRKDVYETTSSLYLTLARSAAGMIPNQAIQNIGNHNVRISGAPLTAQGICPKERFSDQISAARCSGFLIGPDLLATAGHCMTGPADCHQNAFVFDYAVTSPNQKTMILPSANVYKCKEIIKTVLDNRTMNDYAVIRLDRNVNDRLPLKFRKEGRPAIGDDLVVIGCPTGIPLKISDGAKVRSLRDTHFVANLDTYGGNSGSAVFNATTGMVEGVLVRGENDYVRDPSGCMVSKVCTNDGCRGEDVTYSSHLEEILKNI